MGQFSVELTDANFKELVLDSDKAVLVDFWAEWCGPCKAIGPAVEEIAESLGGTAVVGKVNVDFNPQTAMAYGIMSIPTLIVFKNGAIVEQLKGAYPKSVIQDKLMAHV